MSCNKTENENNKDLNKPQENVADVEDDVIVICDDNNDELSVQKKRADEMVHQAQRIQAEFDNYRKRTLESAKAVREEGRAEVIEKLLPIIDTFGHAVAIIKDKSVLEGVNLIFDRLNEIFSQFGLRKIDSINKEFDPYFHNAVMTREDAKNKGIVVEVLQEGYLLNGKVIRAATVIVGA